MPQNNKIEVVRENSEPSPKVTGPAIVAYLAAIVDSIASGQVELVPLGIATAVALLGYIIKDKIDIGDLLESLRKSDIDGVVS
jgi:hypothetical protein